uniref:Uncharacterized protein n=1 Tax=Brassica oleracea var. oleracea TaxID=109376 RepID=A0A0D3BHK0_BRAOL
MMKRNTKSPFPAVLCWVVLECRRGLWNPRVLTLSLKSGLGRGRQVTEKHYVTHPTTLSFLQVALGKDDRIAGCWTLGPPV